MPRRKLESTDKEPKDNEFDSQSTTDEEDLFDDIVFDDSDESAVCDGCGEDIEECSCEESEEEYTDVEEETTEP